MGAGELPAYNAGIVDQREFQDRRRRVDGLENMRGQPALVELQRRCPMLESDEPVDVPIIRRRAGVDGHQTTARGRRAIKLGTLRAKLV
jgi:hypothetical protein